MRIFLYRLKFMLLLVRYFHPIYIFLKQNIHFLKRLIPTHRLIKPICEFFFISDIWKFRKGKNILRLPLLYIPLVFSVTFKHKITILVTFKRYKLIQSQLQLEEQRSRILVYSILNKYRAFVKLSIYLWVKTFLLTMKSKDVRHFLLFKI